MAKVDLSQRPFRIWSEEREQPILAETLILSTGATAKRMDIPGADEYWQRGISACAVCDGLCRPPPARHQHLPGAPR